MKILKTVNIKSTGEVTTLSRMKLDSYLGIYVTSLIKNNLPFFNKYRKKEVVNKKVSI